MMVLTATKHSPVGEEDGPDDGETVGAIVGGVVGATVGPTVGVLVGPPDGGVVGGALGDEEGLSLGDGVGPTVGDSVGDTDGESVTILATSWTIRDQNISASSSKTFSAASRLGSTSPHTRVMDDSVNSTTKHHAMIDETNTLFRLLVRAGIPIVVCWDRVDVSPMKWKQVLRLSFLMDSGAIGSTSLYVIKQQWCATYCTSTVGYVSSFDDGSKFHKA